MSCFSHQDIPASLIPPLPFPKARFNVSKRLSYLIPWKQLSTPLTYPAFLLQMSSIQLILFYIPFLSHFHTSFRLSRFKGISFISSAPCLNLWFFYSTDKNHSINIFPRLSVITLCHKKSKKQNKTKNRYILHNMFFFSNMEPGITMTGASDQI